MREKKIVLAALSKVRGGKPETKYFLKIEKILFDSLIEQINISRKEIFENNLVKIREKSHKIMIEGQKKKKKSNEIVIVIEDIPEFIGMDMKTYNLRKNDVLTLSKEISDLLHKRNVIWILIFLPSIVMIKDIEF